VTKPAVTVVMPVYNRAHLIGDAIQSVRIQTFPDWELVVVDDGSTDATRDVVWTFTRGDPRIRLVPNSGRTGPAGARNTGIRAAGTELIAFLDSDDLWDPNKLEVFYRAFEGDPHAVLIGSDYKMADEATLRTTTMKSYLYQVMLPWWSRLPLAAPLIPVESIRDDIHLITDATLLLSMTIAGFPWIHTSSAAVRREAALAVGLFDEGLTRTEDIDLWLRLSRFGRVAYVDEVLASYDTRGRSDGTGIRYKFYARSRRHSPYDEVRYHLHSLKRIARASDLNEQQRHLAAERLMAYHHSCAIAALGERRSQVFLHVAACLTDRDKRRQLLCRPHEFFHSAL
jgi:glycosyltransferase involved in cell wall biosynthesis